MRTMSLTAVRRTAIAAQGYAARSRRGTGREVETTIRALSCVQLDSITAVERSHRITLGARVGDYPRTTRLAPPRAGPGLRVLGPRGVPDPRRRLAALPPGHAAAPSLAGRRAREEPRARGGGARRDPRAGACRLPPLRGRRGWGHVELEAGEGGARGAVAQRRGRDRRPCQRVPAALRPGREGHPARGARTRRNPTSRPGSAT